jgi:hypothetical protein
MWNRLKEHWIVAVLLSVVVAVAAIVTFLSGLAAIWGVLSHDTLPDFLARKGWTMTGWLSGPPWMNLVVMVVAFAVLIVQVELLRQAYTQRVYETGRVDRDTLATMRNERDAAINGEIDTKLRFGRERLVFFSNFKFGGIDPAVTIRYVGHGPDYAIVQQIEKIFAEFAPRWKVDVDGSNKPALRPDATFKVVFELDGPEAMRPVVTAFVSGQLLRVPMGERIGDRLDSHHLIIDVLPDAV